jgi:DNA-binding transcriptional ArsR family regulator
VKQITDIDDPRIVKGLAHPLRIHILRILQERVASPSEIAAESDASLGTVSYHVRYLERVGLIELTRTRARRGAVEHYYRAVGGIQIDDRAWSALPRAARDGLLGATLEQIGQDVGRAAANGGFARDDTQITRRALSLDRQGFSELSAAARRLLEEAGRIERESIERLNAAEGEPDVKTRLVMMVFDQDTGTEDGPGATRN